MSELPEGWAMAKLSEITSDAAQYIPATDELFTYIDIGSIDRNTKMIVTPQVLLGKNAPSRARKKVAKGDTLVSMTRPNLNAVAQVPPELDGQIASTGFDVLRPLNGIDPRWLSYLVRTKEFVSAMTDLVQGALYPAVRAKDIRSYEAPIAPSNEQTRIADQLDTLLARVNACNNHLDAIPGILKRFRQAVFQAAATGALTVDLGKNDEVSLKSIQLGDEHLRIPSSWQVTELEQVIDPSRPLCYGVVQPGNEDANGVPLIRVQDMSDGTVRSAQLRTVSRETDHEYRRSRVLGGEVLVSVVGTIGRTAVVPEGIEANIARAVARVACRHGVLGRWVHYWLSTASMQWLLLRSSKEVARKTLNLTDLARIPVAVPNLEEQALIVERVERLFVVADQIEKRYAAAKASTNRLAPQVLAKAFRGELVQQDPQDQPVSVLLQRLAAHQSDKSPAPRGRSRAQSTALAKVPERELIDWTSLPNGVWTARVDQDEHLVVVSLIAVLRARGEPIPEQEARLASLFCLLPGLFSAVLPAAQAKQWVRLVGADALPLPANVARLQPVINSHWGHALKGMRARGDLVEVSTEGGTTWALGPGASSIDTTGWPDGRASFVMAHLRDHGIASILPLLGSTEREYVSAKAA